jgi:hypothetical protein
MKLMKITLVLFMLLIISGCGNGEQGVENKFHGMWKLEKIQSLDKATGRWTDDPFFEGWEGYILYDGQGHMGAEIVPKGYREFDPNKNPDTVDMDRLKELVKFYKSNFVYFANYKIADGTIAHERLIATNPKDWGTVLKRDFEFRNDTLILSPHEILWGKKSRLWWVKQ